MPIHINNAISVLWLKGRDDSRNHQDHMNNKSENDYEIDENTQEFIKYNENNLKIANDFAKSVKLHSMINSEIEITIMEIQEFINENFYCEFKKKSP